jgi:protein N-terminal methyltransferase
MDGEPIASNTAMWSARAAEASAAAAAAFISSDNNADVESNGRYPPVQDTAWYEKSVSYWESQDATVKGMLGGLDNLSDRDIKASQAFLSVLERRHGLRIKGGIALDVGAGIGRITKELLLPLFSVVDMLDQSPCFLEESKKFLQPSLEDPATMGVVERKICCGMQDFAPEDAVTGVSYRGRYNLIFVQWCIIYLDDDDFITHTKNQLENLAPGGILVIKDNIMNAGRNGFCLDRSDNSIMRSDKYMKSLFVRSGARVIAEQAQTDMPRNTFPVRMYALVSDMLEIPALVALSRRSTRRNS